MAPVLSRSESKARTRQRLLDAALAIVDERGEAGLTTTAVARAAGIAQSGFYVHFADMNDLLHGLIDDLALQRREAVRMSRQLARAAPSDIEQFRETFRVPLRSLLSHPVLLRLVVRSRHDPTSPIGEWSRSLLEETRRDLVADLVILGVPWRTATERRKATMIADGLIALTETLALGHVDGRYPNLEEVIDTLLEFSEGYLSNLGQPAGSAR